MCVCVCVCVCMCVCVRACVYLPTSSFAQWAEAPEYTDCIST